MGDSRGLRQACCYGIGIDIEIYTRVILRYYWVVFVNVTESLELVMDSVDRDCNFPGRVGYRSKGKPEEAVQQIVSDLVEKDVFNYLPGREGHPSFPTFPSSLLHKLDYRDLHKWISGHLKEWQLIYNKRKQ